MQTIWLPQKLDVYYVYLMLCRDGSGPAYIKFGYTKDVGRRYASIRADVPMPVIGLCFVETGPRRQSALRLEAKLHHLFAERRVRGEWFRFDLAQDKRYFNDTWRTAFDAVLGAGHKWTEINLKALSKALAQKRMAYLKTPWGKAYIRRVQTRLELRRYRAA